jgi:hypothetical protein
MERLELEEEELQHRLLAGNQGVEEEGLSLKVEPKCSL